MLVLVLRLRFEPWTLCYKSFMPFWLLEVQTFQASKFLPVWIRIWFSRSHFMLVKMTFVLDIYTIQTKIVSSLQGQMENLWFSGNLFSIFPLVLLKPSLAYFINLSLDLVNFYRIPALLNRSSSSQDENFYYSLFAVVKLWKNKYAILKILKVNFREKILTFWREMDADDLTCSKCLGSVLNIFWKDCFAGCIPSILSTKRDIYTSNSNDGRLWT